MSKKDSKRKKTKAAKSLYAQKEVHELLYSDDWYEADNYHQQFRKIIDKARLEPSKIIPEAEIKGVKEFCKAIEDMADGRKKVDRTRLFYKLMCSLEKQKLSVRELKEIFKTEEDIAKLDKIVKSLEQCKYLRNQNNELELTPKGRKILSKLKLKL